MARPTQGVKSAIPSFTTARAAIRFCPQAGRPALIPSRAGEPAYRCVRFALTRLSSSLHRLAALLLPTLTAALLCGAGGCYAADYVSVSENSAILYDAPSLKAKKLFVVNRYMPFELVVVLDSWVKVRDRSGGLYWVEKSALSGKRYVYALLPVLDVLAEPDPGAPRLFQVRQQVALEYLETTDTGWVKVRYQDTDVGYVNGTDVWGD